MYELQQYKYSHRRILACCLFFNMEESKVKKSRRPGGLKRRNRTSTNTPSTAIASLGITRGTVPVSPNIIKGKSSANPTTLEEVINLDGPSSPTQGKITQRVRRTTDKTPTEEIKLLPNSPRTPRHDTPPVYKGGASSTKPPLPAPTPVRNPRNAVGNDPESPSLQEIIRNIPVPSSPKTINPHPLLMSAQKPSTAKEKQIKIVLDELSRIQEHVAKSQEKLMHGYSEMSKLRAHLDESATSLATSIGLETAWSGNSY